jgi:hypothetical protein
MCDHEHDRGAQDTARELGGNRGRVKTRCLRRVKSLRRLVSASAHCPSASAAHNHRRQNVIRREMKGPWRLDGSGLLECSGP